MLYRVHSACAWFELTTLVVIGTNFIVIIVSCKSNYHDICINISISFFLVWRHPIIYLHNNSFMLLSVSVESFMSWLIIPNRFSTFLIIEPAVKVIFSLFYLFWRVIFFLKVRVQSLVFGRVRTIYKIYEIETKLLLFVLYACL
jgi:hypothetical protein